MENLRKLIYLNGNQKNIAKDLNISPQTFNNYVNGKTDPDIKTLIKIADYFHVSLDELVGRETNMINLNCLEENDAYIIKKLLKMNQMEKLRTKAFVMGLTE